MYSPPVPAVRPPDPTNVIGRRIVAFAIDTLIVSFVGVATMMLIRTGTITGVPSGARVCDTLRETQGFDGVCVQVGSRAYLWADGRAFSAWGAVFGVWLLNLVFLQGIAGATLGKMVLSLRTVDGEGRICGVGRALVRSILLFVDTLCFGLVGFVTVTATRPHRRVGDMAGGTYVVRTGDVGTRIAPTPPPFVGPSPWEPPAPADAWTQPPSPPAPAASQPWGTPPPPPTWGAPPAPSAPPWGAPPVRPVPEPSGDDVSPEEPAPDDTRRDEPPLF